ncbi:hypothetical protein OUZ56_010967 [Daphnia magna]|uniref:Uncharacterized protein n=1 Tax=Daphnia magna TaxID=35525 RepID=A0ABQ9YZ18_9CRUS|nr:hypothetical protein OUZ56_010967 [Daphnia magna]
MASTGILSLIAVIMVGLILMTATGLIVYYGFCPVSQTTDSSAATSASKCNCPQLPTCPLRVYCPVEPAEPCPPNPLMPAPADPSACIPPCCTEQKTISHSTDRPVPEKWTEEQLMNQTVLEWVMAYPPNSMGRLNVLTQLMELGVEPYVRAMSRRNCQAPYRMCTMCHSDRYEFLRCAMRTRVTANKHGYKSTNKLKKMSWDFLKNYAADAYWHSQKYDNLLTRDDYQPLSDAYRAFWFIGNDGGLSAECSWCRDAFEPSVHMNCIRDGWGSI